MQKNNKKKLISIAAVLKILAKRSFVVFLMLVLLAAAVSLIVYNYRGMDTDNQSGLDKKGLFNADRAKQYREVFLLMEKRQKDNEAAKVEVPRGVFKELTEQ